MVLRTAGARRDQSAQAVRATPSSRSRARATAGVTKAPPPQRAGGGSPRKATTKRRGRDWGVKSAASASRAPTR